MLNIAMLKNTLGKQYTTKTEKHNKQPDQQLSDQNRHLISEFKFILTHEMTTSIIACEYFI